VALTRTVLFLEGASGWPYARQSPANDGVFGSTQFRFHPDDGPADWLVVLNTLPPGGELKFPRERTVLLWGEPPLSPRLARPYVLQFGTFVCVDRHLRYPNARHMSPFVPWHVGVATGQPEAYPKAMTFSELLPAPPKTRLCSCVMSNLSALPGHRLRLRFLDELMRRLGDRIDFFGRGLRPIADKDEALAGYRYHIAIENSAVPDYWTEKLADPLLRNCFPIYYGAPNIHDYFDPAALALIDIRNPSAAVERITAILDSDHDMRAAEAVAHAKNRVLWDYNMLARIDALLNELEPLRPPLSRPQRLRPESEFLGSLARAQKRLRTYLNARG